MVEEDEEGSGDGPLSREIEEKKGWEFEIKNKQDSSKSAEDSFEFGHNYRGFHLGYP